ncbi:MAG: putative molybdenum carrier protein [Planctomycetota bacterium]|nr:putative molybdenum carrier protein [Planctomycetota bacterium]
MSHASIDIQKIVSGGQTGVDRAALDVALDLNIPCGGWCPRGRLAEDGWIDERYPLQATESRNYTQRTRRNVRDSDGTLILTVGKLTGGTSLTKSYAARESKPYFIVDLDLAIDIEPVLRWLAAQRIQQLNVAGPRASSQPGIYEQADQFLRQLLSHIRVESSDTL